MRIKFYYLFFYIIFFNFCVYSQVIIHGEIKDFATDSLLENCNIKNIYTQRGYTTTTNGQFEISIKKGELFECSKVGYQTLRIRIYSEKEPTYFKLVLKKAPIILKEFDVRGKPLDFVSDSIRYRETYDIVLRKERQHEVDFRSLPLAMLSKKNRQEWAFQKMYEKLEQEKYIDYVFNEKLITRITYLTGDRLKQYMMLYRPTHQFLRTATEYEYLDYIKHCYYLFKASH